MTAIRQLVEALVSIKRLEDFFAIKEIPDYSRTKPKHDLPKDSAVSFKDVTANWSNATEKDVIQNVSFTIKPGTLVAVIGRVGAGKSSLLHIILKEIPLKSGNLEINGELSFASQSSFIFNATIRQNILFGQDYDEDRYGKFKNKIL